MRILIANLKHLYQRRFLWMVYAFLGFFAWLRLSAVLHEHRMNTLEGRVPAETGWPLAVIFAAVVVGWIVAEMQMSILVKPFSFCLPGHRQAVRKVVLLTAVATSLMGSLAFLVYPVLLGGQRELVLCSTFFAGLAAGTGTAWLGLRSARAASVSLAFAMFILFGGFFDLPILIERALVEHPIPVMGLGGLVTLAVWIHLGHGNLARERCLKPWFGLGETLRPERLARMEKARLEASQWKGFKEHPRPWVEHLFLGRMARPRVFSTARFVWGALYVSFGLMMSRWRAMIVPVLVIALFLGFGNPALWLVWIMAMIAAGTASRPALYSKMLVAGGRRERFYATLAVTVINTCLLLLCGGAAILVSIPLAGIMPELAYKGMRFHYQVIDVRMLYVPLVCLPLISAIRLIFYPRLIGVVVILAMVFQVGAMMSISSRGVNLAPLLRPGVVVALAMLCWLAFVLVLNHLAGRRCLVRS